MKILFCIYQLDYADHISIAYLSAVAKKRGHQTYFCLLNDMENVVRTVRPDLVAYSLNIYGFDKVVAEHKHLQPQYNFMSIAGGPQCTFNSQLYEQTNISTYCIGEGELAWDEYLSRIENGQTVDDVANLITPNGANAVRPWIRDLDSLPMPDRDLVLSNSFLKYTPKKTFYTTRGCPFSCYYCANNYYNDLYKGKGKILRRFGADRIMEEIKMVQSKYRMDFLKFGDDLFAVKPDAWLEHLARRYRNEVNVPFNCFLRIDWVNDDLIKLLKSMRCHSIHLSVDSASEDIRERILGRKMRKVDFKKQLRMIDAHGIHTFVNFMLAAPDSTIQDDLDSINIAHGGRVTCMHYSTTVPTQGTRLFDYAESHGMIPTDHYSQDMSGCSQPSQLTSFTQKEKDVRFNIYMLGGVAAKLPTPLRQFVVFLIKHTKPNRLYTWMQGVYSRMYFDGKIFNNIRKTDATAT